jgi:hypothetical protein
MITSRPRLHRLTRSAEDNFNVPHVRRVDELPVYRDRAGSSSLGAAVRVLRGQRPIHLLLAGGEAFVGDRYLGGVDTPLTVETQSACHFAVGPVSV